MRWITVLVLSSALATPALAQTPQTPPPPPPHHRMRARPHARPQARMERGTPEDRGPFTPEANRAYDGGGAILQGAPGAPRPPASAVLTQPPGRPLPPPMAPR